MWAIYVVHCEHRASISVLPYTFLVIWSVCISISFSDKTVVGAWSNCICFMEDGKKISFGVQFRVKTCFSSCKNKKGCPSERVQNRTCACNSIAKTSVKPGMITVFYNGNKYSPISLTIKVKIKLSRCQNSFCILIIRYDWIVPPWCLKFLIQNKNV